MANKHNKQSVVKLCKKHNIEIDDDGFSISLVAPDGYCFAGYDFHATARVVYGDGSYTKPETWEILWQDANCGVEPCNCEDCKIISQN